MLPCTIFFGLDFIGYLGLIMNSGVIFRLKKKIDY